MGLWGRKGGKGAKPAARPFSPAAGAGAGDAAAAAAATTAAAAATAPPGAAQGAVAVAATAAAAAAADGGPAARPGARGPRSVTYRVDPANYAILSEHEKSAVLRGFVGIVRAAGRRVTLTVMNRAATAVVGGEAHGYLEKSVHLTSAHDLGPALLGGGFRAVRLDRPLEFRVDREAMASMRMAEGGWWRAYVVHRFPHSIRPAWINDLAEICSVTAVDIAPIRPGAARRTLVSHANTLESRPGRRHHEEAADARAVNDMLQRQETTAYDCRITAVVTGADPAGLARNCALFERNARWRQIGAMAVAGRQADTLLRGWGSHFVFEESSCAAFYPFRSADMIEADGAGGVYLGTNEITGAPVVYDYLRRTNYNMTVLGSSGSGKSVTAKTYVDNFFAMVREKYGAEHRVMSYVLDLHGEYVRLAGRWGMGVLDLAGRGRMGLDPFALLPTADQAADLLTDVAGMPPNLKSLAVSKSAGAGSVEGMVGGLRADGTGDAEDCRKAATYLAQFAGDGGIAEMFRGDAGMRDRTVISMRGAAKTALNAMLISLALQRAWRDMLAAPRHVPKLLVIEEAWFLLAMPGTAAILDNMARSGRKENVHMLVMTQDVDEMLNSDHGAAVIKNSATVVLLGLTPASATLLQKALDLSDSERDEVSSMGKGQAIMRADRNRIKVRVRPTDEQLRLFNTAAEGFAAPAGEAEGEKEG